jgi:formate/nitrite transporter FocA (FNT family)
LLQGLGFSAGFFMIILSRAALFTEANVILHARYLHANPIRLPRSASRFLALAWLGNMSGAFVMAAFFAAEGYFRGVWLVAAGRVEVMPFSGMLSRRVSPSCLGG